ncbi:MAG TPA: AI-2E family transporter [bacterium]|nr:AI-2E family transporter [bacterium]
MSAKNNIREKLTVDISSLTLIKVLVIIIVLMFLFYIRDIILTVFIALILASAFDPWVDWFQKNKIPRTLGLLVIYAAVILVLAGAVYFIIPPIVTEVNQLSKDFPVYSSRIISSFESLRNYSNTQGWSENIQGYLTGLQANVGVAAGGVFNTIFSFFGGIFSFFIIMVITFYMTVEEQAMKRMMRLILPVKYQPYFTYLLNRIQDKIGRWLRGQLLLSLIIFILVWLGLSLLGIRYALVLALFAGVTELIPYLGPFLGAIPAVFIGLTHSPLIALGVVILYLLIQFLENNVIVPKVMQRAVGLNPIITLVAILIGARVAGIIGVVLAVPVATAISVVVNDIVEAKD